MALDRLTVFSQTLQAAGVPFSGLSVSADPPGPTTVTIQYTAGATADQRTQGQQLLQTFDWRPRRDLSLAAVYAGLAGLTSAQQDTLSLYQLAAGLLANPSQTAAVLLTTGIPLAVDEIDPNPNPNP